MRRAGLRKADYADQKDADTKQHGSLKKKRVLKCCEEPGDPDSSQLNSYALNAIYFGLRDASPLDSAISAMREPLIPIQEFLVRGYLSV